MKELKTTIKASAVVVGDEMEVLERGYVLIKDSVIAEIGCGDPSYSDRVIKAQGCVVIPGFVNAHTHVGDSAFKDVGFGRTLDELFRPPDGLKHHLLRSTPRNHIVGAIRDSLIDMLHSGITTFADFREGGVEGVKILLEAIGESKMRGLIFGRPDYAFTKEQLESNEGLFPREALGTMENLLVVAHGLAPSSPNDLTDEALRQLASVARKHGRPKAIHVAEHPKSLKISKCRTSLTEVERALVNLEADFLVHLTYATSEDLDLVASHRLSVVCCPRSNAALGLKLPPIPKMLDREINVALGTDNVMLNTPDMLREMEFAVTAYCIQGVASRGLNPREVLKMATINGAKALGVDSAIGSINNGKLADLVVLDFNLANLKYSQDLLTTLVRRARPDNVKLVMIEGELVYDRDSEFKRGDSSQSA